MFKTVKDYIFEKQVDSVDIQSFLNESLNLYLNAHFAHWNVKGQRFDIFHRVFSEIYTFAYESIDVLAERIRAKDQMVAPVDVGVSDKFKMILNSPTQSNETGLLEAVIEAIKNISESAEKLIDSSSAVNDQVTMNIAIELKTWYDKILWQLNSMKE